MNIEVWDNKRIVIEMKYQLKETIELFETCKGETVDEIVTSPT